MRIHMNDTVEKIDGRKMELLKTRHGRKAGMGVTINRGKDVVLNGMVLCTIDDLKELIDNLDALHEAIADVTGIVIE